MQRQLEPHLVGTPEFRLTLGAADQRAAPEHELAADEALKARSSHESKQLLLEGPVESLHAHSWRNTPITLPRTSTCSA